jgi:hypothetical protein
MIQVAGVHVLAQLVTMQMRDGKISPKQAPFNDKLKTGA